MCLGLFDTAPSHPGATLGVFFALCAGFTHRVKGAKAMPKRKQRWPTLTET
jgi:hypothetical protein